MVRLEGADTPDVARSIEKADPQPDRARIRFALTVTIYGATVGAMALLVNLLSQAQFEHVAAHMPWPKTALFGVAGAIGGVVTAGPFAYWLYGRAPSFRKEDDRSARSLLIWVILGFMFGFVYPLVMGGFFLPMAFGLLDFFTGATSVPNLLVDTFDLLTGQWPGLAIILGFRLFFTGLYAGLVFGVGAWVIDRFNASADSTTATYGPWAMSVALSAGLMALVLLGPESTLSKLGG